MRRLSICSVLAIVLVLLGVTTVTAQGQQQPVCFVSEVQVTGVMDYGGYVQEFEQVGYVGVTVVGFDFSANASDVSVIFGTPVTNPSVGALAFVSNAFYVGSLSDTYRTGAVDLAVVTTGETENGAFAFLAEVPSDFTSNYGVNQGLMANVFNWGGGIAANVKLVTGGYVYFEYYNDGSMAGEIDLVGRDWTSNRDDISYTAEVHGTLVGGSANVNDCVITSR